MFRNKNNNNNEPESEKFSCMGPATLLSFDIMSGWTVDLLGWITNLKVALKLIPINKYIYVRRNEQYEQRFINHSLYFDVQVFLFCFVFSIIFRSSFYHHLITNEHQIQFNPLPVSIFMSRNFSSSSSRWNAKLYGIPNTITWMQTERIPF